MIITGGVPSRPDVFETGQGRFVNSIGVSGLSIPPNTVQTSRGFYNYTTGGTIIYDSTIQYEI